MINYLTNPDIVSHEVVEEGWSVKSLLNKIANADPPYHALIDTGALITGMTNFQVTRKLKAAVWFIGSDKIYLICTRWPNIFWRMV